MSSRWLVFAVLSLTIIACGRKSTTKPEGTPPPEATQPRSGPAPGAPPAVEAESVVTATEASPPAPEKYQAPIFLEGGCSLTTASFPALLREYFKHFQNGAQGDPTAQMRSSECQAWISQLLLQLGARTPKAKPVPVTEACEEWLGNQNPIYAQVADGAYPLSSPDDVKGALDQLEKQGSYATLMTRLDSCAERYPDAVARLQEATQELWELRYLDNPQDKNLYLRLGASERETRRQAATTALMIARGTSYYGAVTGGMGRLAVSGNFQLFTKLYAQSVVPTALASGAIYGVWEPVYQWLDRPEAIPVPPAFLSRMGYAFEEGVFEKTARKDDLQRFVTDAAGAATGTLVTLATAARLGGKAVKYGTKIYNVFTIPLKWNPAVLASAVAAVGAGYAVDRAMSEGSLRLTRLLSRREICGRVVKAANDFEVSMNELRASQPSGDASGDMRMRETRARVFILSKKLVEDAMMLDIAQGLPVMEAQLSYETLTTGLQFIQAAAESQFASRQKSLVTEACGGKWVAEPINLSIDFAKLPAFQVYGGLTNAPAPALTPADIESLLYPQYPKQSDEVAAQVKAVLASEQWSMLAGQRIQDRDSRRAWSRRAAEVKMQFSQTKSEIKIATDEAADVLADLAQKNFASRTARDEARVRRLALADAWLRAGEKAPDMTAKLAGADAVAMQTLVAEAGPNVAQQPAGFSRFLREKLDAEFDQLRTELLQGKVSEDPALMLMQVLALVRGAGDLAVLRQTEGSILSRLRYYKQMWDRIGRKP